MRTGIQALKIDNALSWIIALAYFYLRSAFLSKAKNLSKQTNRLIPRWLTIFLSINGLDLLPMAHKQMGDANSKEPRVDPKINQTN